MSRKLINVIMPVYNGMPFLIDAVESILKQAEQRFKLLVIDDGSDDNSVDYIKSINSSKIEIHSIGRQGLVKALNFGLSLVDSEYVAIMDSDDISDHDRLRLELDFLNTHSEFIAVGTSFRYIISKPSHRYFQVNMPNDDKEIKMGLFKGNYVICHSTLMVKSSILKEVGGYETKDYPAPDLGLFLRLSKKGKLTNLSSCYCYVRLHNRSFTSRNLIHIVKKVNREVKYPHNLPLIVHILTKIDLMSLRFYRLGILTYLKNTKCLFIFFFILAGLINPKRAIRFLRFKWH